MLYIRHYKEVVDLQSILIPATKSLTVTNKLPNGNINEDIIIVGGDGEFIYVSYLFFDISSIPSNVTISSAELVLFKTNNFYNDSSKEFIIYPLIDYFSTYTTFNNSPNVSTIIKKNFYPITSKVAATVDITHFAVLWSMNRLTNTGIALFSKDNNILAEFGSSISKDAYLIPFIKVVISPIVRDGCNNCCSQEVIAEKVRVIGTVAAASKYEAVVNVGIKRSGSGHTDNYYVVDEYDNSSSGNSLPIDKTYNVAIVPKKKPGDAETVDFYGSYKE